MAGRGSGDHLYSQQQPVDPGGGGNSILAAAAKRLRQEMAGRLRPHQPSPPATSAALLPPPSPPLQSKVPSVESLASKTVVSQIDSARPTAGQLEDLARAIQ